jgi:protein-disulfide isomerase
MSSLEKKIGPGDHIAGPRDAPVTLVEYGDFQCPYCGKAYQEMKRLQQMLGDQLCFVFRHFPLTQLHPDALQAAEAAEAAGVQGRFWEMHDLLFENQDALDEPDLVSYAEELGLDLDRFTRDLEEHRFVERIERDLIEGTRSGVHGTPTFFLNGFRHEGGYTAEALLDEIQGGAAARGL